MYSKRKEYSPFGKKNEESHWKSPPKSRTRNHIFSPCWKFNLVYRVPFLSQKMGNRKPELGNTLTLIGDSSMYTYVHVSELGPDSF